MAFQLKPNGPLSPQQKQAALRARKNTQDALQKLRAAASDLRAVGLSTTDVWEEVPAELSYYADQIEKSLNRPVWR